MIGISGSNNPFFGKHHTPEAREKIRLGHLGKPSSSPTKFSKGIIPWNKGKKLPQFSGENHPNWKKNCGYDAVHHWVKNRLGKATKCEFCGIELSEKRIEWANKSYQYLRDTADWFALCSNCHRKYDKNNGWGKALERFPERRGRVCWR